MKFRKIKKIIVISILACTSVFSLSSCSEEVPTSVLNVHNANVLSTEIIDTPWKNQSLPVTLMYRSLFMADAVTTTLSHDLVKLYKISDDLLKYTFVIRDDIVWSDGEKLDVDDVIFSIKGLLLAEQFNGIYQTAFGSIVGANEFMQIGEIDAELSGLEKEEDMITMTLETPIYNMIEILAQFAILPEHCFTNSDIKSIHAEDYWKNPVVSGMYLVDEIVPNDYIKLVQNDKYVGTKPKIEEIMIHADYLDSELDIYNTTDINEILNYRANSNMQEHKINSMFYRYFAFNIDKGGEIDPVINDVRFREAIAYAIDRELILKDIYLDIGDIIDSAVSSENEAYVESPVTYDPEKARELLAEMEYDFDRPVKLYFYYKDEISIQFMNKVKEQLEDIGLTVILHEPNDTSIFVFDDYDICLKGLSAFNVSEWYGEYQSTNAMHINMLGGEPIFDNLIEELAIARTEQERNEILKELQMLEFETWYKIPLFTLGQRMYVNKNKLSIPSNVEFGNAWYKYDLKFEEWEILN